MNEIVKNTLSSAGECLLDAQALLLAQRWKASVSRCYYAMYHSTKAILLSIGIETFTHQGVNIQFNKHFIKTSVFDKSISRSFSKMLDNRLASDYEIGFNATENEAKHAYNEAEIFNKLISDYLIDIEKQK